MKEELEREFTKIMFCLLLRRDNLQNLFQYNNWKNCWYKNLNSYSCVFLICITSVGFDSTFTKNWKWQTGILLSLLGLELIALQSKPQDTSCLPALKVSDIEPKIPFTVLETTLTGWCNHCSYCYLAACPAVALFSLCKAYVLTVCCP